MQIPTPIEYIDTPDRLVRFCEHLVNSPWVAIDTEFMRERTYTPILCLLQMATPNHLACIDTLALTDLTALRPCLQSPDTIKILHSGRQDIEVLRNLWGESPAPVFDTQIAATLSGYPDQIGYAALIDTLCGVQLDKQHTRTDWSRRPLSPEQIQYAAEDVLYLGDAYRMLDHQLTQLGRQSWLAEECTSLLDPALYETAPHESWRRFRSAAYMPPDQLAALKALAAWRESTAQTRNLPRTWLLKDDVLCALAQLKPEHIAAQSDLPGLEPQTQKRYGAELLALLKAVHQSLDPDAFEASPARPPQLSPEQKATLRRLADAVQAVGRQLDISPAILANRKDLEALMLDPSQPSRLQRGWRKSALGNTLAVILEEAGISAPPACLNCVLTAHDQAKLICPPPLICPTEKAHPVE